VNKANRNLTVTLIGVATAVIVAAPAHADPDVDFANELHTYGIYGQTDCNAWIGEITCKRLNNGLDLVVPPGLHLRAAARFTQSLKRGGHVFRSALAFAATA